MLLRLSRLFFAIKYFIYGLMIAV